MHVRVFGAVNFRKEKKCIWKESITKMTADLVRVLYCSAFNCGINTIFSAVLFSSFLEVLFRPDFPPLRLRGYIASCLHGTKYIFEQEWEVLVPW